MHIFLTGEKQVGKTTAIRNFLTTNGLTADGFVTYWEPGGADDAARTLYLAPYDAESRNEKRYIVAFDRGKGLVFSDETLRMFDIYGSEILAGSGRCDYIVMDELGFLETKALIFRQAVMRHISGDVPVLGVLKASKTEFLNVIRAHPGVEVREVTAENRNTILK